MSAVTPTGNRLERLEQLVPLCESIRKGGEYRAALAQAAGEVRRTSTLPARLLALAPLLTSLNGTEHLSSDDLLVDLRKVETAGRTLEQCVNTEALRDARFAAKEAEEAVQRIEARTSKAWSIRVEAEFGPAMRLGGVLAEIADTKATGIELQKWATRALALAAPAVPTANSVQQFHDAQAEQTARFEALGKLGVDAAVRAFLQEVANKRATLAAVTPAVLEWLRARNAHSRFRIDLKA